MSRQEACIGDLGRHEGQEVALRGWLYHKRDIGKIRFLVMRDGTGYVQGVVSSKSHPDAFETAGAITQESSFEMAGCVRKDTRAPGGYEIIANTPDEFSRHMRAQSKRLAQIIREAGIKPE